jgi:hypothetical protein
LATFGLADDHTINFVFFKSCPHLLELNRTLKRTALGPEHGPELPTLINILAGGYALRGNLPRFLDPHQKTCFEVVWKAPKETCFMLLVLLPKRKDSAFHQLFTFSLCISLAPIAHGPAYAEI